MENYNVADCLLLLEEDGSKVRVYDKQTQKIVKEFELNGTNDPLQVEQVEGKFKLVRIANPSSKGFHISRIRLSPFNYLVPEHYDFIGAVDIIDERAINLTMFPICLKKVSSTELQVHLKRPLCRDN